MQDNKHQPAFPVVADFGKDDRQCSEGLTKLEYFIGQSMIGIRANPNKSMTAGEVAEQAIEDAQAVIAQLNALNS